MWRRLCLIPVLLTAACAPQPRPSPAAPPAIGLVRPPAGIDPGIHTTVPNPRPGTTPVIPPDPRIDPR